MGMFDYYEPVPEIACPECGTPLREWQGKSGPCALFIWRQGTAAPTAQRADEECALPLDARERFRLSSDAEIYSDCPTHGCVLATCVVEDAMWTKTTDVRCTELKRSRR